MNMEQESNLAQTMPQSSTQYASFGRRFLAYVVDWGIISLIGIVIQSMLGLNSFSAVMHTQSLEELQQLQATTRSSLPTLISLALGLAYFLIFWVNYDGATPGKRLMAIKITKDDSFNLTYPIAFIRYIGIFISTISLGLGYLWVVWDKKKQAWHDKIAKTIVVKTEAKPKTLLAIFLSIIVVLFFAVYTGATMYKGYKLGAQEMEQKKKDTYSGRSIKKSENEMNPEAKIHFERSQELFKQMRQVADNPEKILQLNDENIQELKKALEIESDNPRIWVELGNAYTWISSEGSLEDSLKAFQKAEELDPNNVVYINGVGDILIRMERYEDAILQFQKTFRLTQKSGFAHLSTGIAYKRLGIYDSAREHFQKAIEIFTKANKEGRYDDEILQARKEMAGLPK